MCQASEIKRKIVHEKHKEEEHELLCSSKSFFFMWTKRNIRAGWTYWRRSHVNTRLPQPGFSCRITWIWWSCCCKVKARILLNTLEAGKSIWRCSYLCATYSCLVKYRLAILSLLMSPNASFSPYVSARTWNFERISMHIASCYRLYMLLLAFQPLLFFGR